MYSLELNIGSLSTPSAGGGWIEVDADFSKGSVNKALESDQIFARTELEGDLQFSFEEFTALDTLRTSANKCGIRVKHTVGGVSSVIYTGELDLLGTYKENTCILKALADDAYTLILDEKNTKVNILNTTTATKCDLTLESSKLTFYETNVAQSELFYTWLPGSNPPPVYIYAREEAIHPDFVAEEYIGENGWELIESYDDGTTLIARTWSDGGFATATAADMYDSVGDFSGYEVNDIIQYGTHEMTYLGRRGTQRGLLMYNSFYYDNEGYITFSRFRKLKSVIMQMVAELDPSIEFDNDSWAYLDANDDLKHLLVANVSDLIVTADPPEERTDGMEFGELTWDDLTEMLRQKLKLYWKLEEVDGVYYFRIVHRSEVNYTTGTVDLTDYNDVDWTRNVWKYSSDILFNRLIRETSWDNYDFRGTDILAPSLDNVAVEKTLADSKWHFDIWDIIGRGGDYYPTSSKNNFCMITAEPYPTDEVEQLTGFNNVLSGYEVFSYSAGTLTAENTTLSGVAQSNTWTGIVGYTYRIVMNLTASTGQKPTVSVTSSDCDGIVLQDGENYIYATATSDGSMYVQIENSEAATFTIEDMSIERYVYNCRLSKGVLSNRITANAELSVANLDETHARYELPDPDVTINHEEVTVTGLLKDKSQTINAPIHSPDYLDEELLITTNKGDCEFESINIPLNGDMPEITVRFR